MGARSSGSGSSPYAPIVGYNNTEGSTTANVWTTIHDLSLNNAQANYDYIVVTTYGRTVYNLAGLSARLTSGGVARVTLTGIVGVTGGYYDRFYLQFVLVAGTHYTKGTAFHITADLLSDATGTIYISQTTAIGGQ